MSVVIVDYGMGNLTSVYNAVKFLGAKCKITDNPADIKKAEMLIFPGVGSFTDAMEELKKRRLVEPIKKYIASGGLFLGICLGQQILFEKSEEGNTAGLGVFKGAVRRFDEKTGIKVPHIGWNSVKFKSIKRKSAILENIEHESYFYFDHSYYADPEDKSIIVASTDYGEDFASVVAKDNIYAVQFHPERSQALGLQVLQNFMKIKSTAGSVSKPSAGVSATASPTAPVERGRLSKITIIPAIDIIDGKVVRLKQGKFDKEKVYSGDAVAFAMKWKDDGAKLLHMIDLDGARSGVPFNLDIVRSVIEKVKIAVEVGGGLRTEENIEKALKSGASYAIVGTGAVQDEELCRRLLDKYGERIVFAVDVKENKVVIKGWVESAKIGAIGYIKKLEALGAKRIIYTDVSKDGMMSGPNLEKLKKILKSTSLEVIVSGGISGIQDIRALKKLKQRNLKGIIVGKAIYEGKINLREAINAG